MLTWISDVGVLARIQLLRVISCWHVSCGDQQRALRNFEATAFCVQEPAVGFPGYSTVRGFDPAGGTPGGSRTLQNPLLMLNTLSSVSVRESLIQYLCDPQWFRDTATGITDSACKNQLVVVSVQYGPFNPYIPIKSTTIGKSRVALDPIAMHTSWRSNSDITSVTSIGYPRMSASGESSTTMHRLLHASGSHPIPTPYDPKVFSQLPCWRLGAWLRPVSRGNRQFTVGGGRLRQSGPRPEGRLLCQPALEGLTRSARTKTPRKVGRSKFRRGATAQGGGGGDIIERRGCALRC
ncbi:hypothetical protein F511_20958 [Dorcoceras hygrometricum]|uniref:Uncharacterized protein n=1 Tax=Dorcoceras hygrometricum TaxID=472368 RepID=A0A2Z7BA96_9LAMI|nr:hypothetical protein F511_20958 [Dorcoceras hygrometricum]